MHKTAAVLRHRELTQEIYNIGDEVAEYTEHLAEAIVDYDGELTEDEAVEQTITGTRRYVRRQRSWFNRDPRTVWLDAAGPDVVGAALDSLA